MARMIPDDGPVPNQSYSAEPKVYRALRRLSDEFVVIHSLPWLSAAARTLDGRPVPTGELDFLILHPRLGILALEVKGGHLRYDRTHFTYVHSGQRLDPINQVRRGTHALAAWVAGAGGPRFRIGYALVFPDSDMGGQRISPALVDLSGGQPRSICMDRNDLPRLVERVVEVMQYWQQVLRVPALRPQQIDELVDLLCPTADYAPRWPSRIEYDTRTWLLLTEEQRQCLRQLEGQLRLALTGRSGTGKTLIAITLARTLAAGGAHVLFLVYNRALREYLLTEVGDVAHVYHFHGLCREASQQLQRPTGGVEWVKQRAATDLRDAIEAGLMPPYDALIIDEAQVFSPPWLEMLVSWFADRPIMACCDETQAFAEFEHVNSAEAIAEVLQAPGPFLLTVNLRSPRLVFDRLTELQPAPYQQSSPRQALLEEGALTEILTSDPEGQLHMTLQELQAQGIPPEAITVLYLQQSPVYQEGVERLVGSTESIYRFRGLESPVVVVWAVGKMSQAALACAYARATSRCIIIYGGPSLLQGEGGPALVEILTRSERPLVGLQNWLDTFWPPRRTMPLTAILTEEAQVSWHPIWGGWVTDRHDDPDPIATTLWRGALLAFAGYPTFTLRYSSLHSYTSWVVRREPPLAIYDIPRSSRSDLAWCTQCRRWTRRKSTAAEGPVCLDCLVPQATPLPQEVLQRLLEFRRLAYLPKADLSLAQYQTLPLPLVALRYWLNLPPAVQERLRYNRFPMSERLLGAVAAVFVAGDVFTTHVDGHLHLGLLRAKYEEWLKHHLIDDVSRKELKQMVSIRINEWLGLSTHIDDDDKERIDRILLVKEAKGVYRRRFNPDWDTPMPPQA